MYDLDVLFPAKSPGKITSITVKRQWLITPAALGAEIEGITDKDGNPIKWKWAEIDKFLLAVNERFRAIGAPELERPISLFERFGYLNCCSKSGEAWVTWRTFSMMVINGHSPDPSYCNEWMRVPHKWAKVSIAFAENGFIDFSAALAHGSVNEMRHDYYQVIGHNIDGRDYTVSKFGHEYLVQSIGGTDCARKIKP